MPRSISGQCIEDISPIEDKFGRKAIEGHRTRPDGSDLKWILNISGK